VSRPYRDHDVVLPCDYRPASTGYPEHVGDDRGRPAPRCTPPPSARDRANAQLEKRLAARRPGDGSEPLTPAEVREITSHWLRCKAAVHATEMTAEDLWLWKVNRLLALFETKIGEPDDPAARERAELEEIEGEMRRLGIPITPDQYLPEHQRTGNTNDEEGDDDDARS